METQTTTSFDECPVHDVGVESCPIYQALDDEFKEYAERNPHLLVYLHEWHKKTGSLPRMKVELSREDGYSDTYSILYPVGDPIFIHVYKTPGDVRGTYHPVEPSIPEEEVSLLEQVEKLVAMRVDETLTFESEEERAQVLEKLFDSVVEKSSETRLLKDKVAVSEDLYYALKYEFMKDKVYLGPLEPMIRDPYIEDISCSGIGPIFVEHKVFKSLASTVVFQTYEELDAFVLKLCERIGRPVSPKRPIVDATLPDGSRLNVVYGRDVSRRGSNFTIRKFSKVPLSVTQLIKFGTFDERIAAYLWMALMEGMSVFVCGETASGKTTTMNAISVFIRPTAKVISIEDTAEVVLPHPNWVSEVTRKSEEEKASITLFDLLKAALRQRPNYIIVGEIRDREGNVAFQAMQTGHPVIATFHAASIDRLIQRLTGDPINVPLPYIDNLNIVVFQSAVMNPVTRRRDRRVTSVTEIIGYDPSSKSCSYIDLFYWEPSKDRHVFRGVGNSYLLEEKVAPRRGLEEREFVKIYEELEVRTQIIRRLVENKVYNYYDVWKVVSSIYNMPPEDALRVVDRICRSL